VHFYIILPATLISTKAIQDLYSDIENRVKTASNILTEKHTKAMETKFTTLEGELQRKNDQKFTDLRYESRAYTLGRTIDVYLFLHYAGYAIELALPAFNTELQNSPQYQKEMIGRITQALNIGTQDKKPILDPVLDRVEKFIQMLNQSEDQVKQLQEALRTHRTQKATWGSTPR